MNRLLLLAMLLTVSASASADSVPVKAAPSPARPDLLSSIRAHTVALGRQPVVLPGVGVRASLAAPPTFDSPRPKIVTVTQGPMVDRR